MVKKSKVKRGRKKLSQPEKLKRQIQRKLSKDFEAFLKELGFAKIKTDGVTIQVDRRTGELDNIFIYENILFVVEYTTGQRDSSHILTKKPLFDKIIADAPRFLAIARKSYPEISNHLQDIYDDSHYRIKILYVPLHDAAQETIETCPNVIFFQGSLKKYFYALGKTIQKSAKIELFNYLDLKFEYVGLGAIRSSSGTHKYEGQLLPESMSSFPSGYKVVSFYADPDTLIAGAYVLRRDGWRDGSHLYQRILVRKKIAKMRRYLIDEKRVFVNNVIVTLPHTAINEEQVRGQTPDPNKARAITISVRAGYSEIGIIDGQHRVFCYHEGDDAFEEKIATLRKRQHLLVTGIIYPQTTTEKARLEFEARLFLEINDTQTRARPALRQDIETIVSPFSGTAVARRVIAELAKTGPYARLFQLSYFDSPAKIKTSSIVSYGLRPLLKFDGDDSLFSAWTHADKEKLKARERKPKKKAGSDEDIELLEHYVRFCVKCLNDFFLAAKLSYGTSNWDVEDDTPSPLLRPTSINGLIACLRRIIEHRMPLSAEAHKNRMKNFSKFNFDNFKSSAWDQLGQSLFEKHYKTSGS